jgi:hypothetical protein
LKYYQEYDRKRSDLPQRVCLRQIYRQSERGKERLRDGRKAWAANHPNKRAAHVITGNALRDGRLMRGPCEVCGNRETEAHHDDYDKPLTVRWLCREHHIEWHTSKREAERESTEELA